MTERDLKEYSVLGRKIKQLACLYEEEGRKIGAPGSPNVTGMPHSGSGGDEALHKALDVRSALLEDINELTALRKIAYRRLSKVMALLGEETHQDVFVRLYHRGLDVRSTAKDLHYSTASVYRIRHDIWNIAQNIEA